MENAVLIIGLLFLFAIGFLAVELLLPASRKAKRPRNRKKSK